MRDYAKVSPRYWTGETGRKIRALGRNAQLMGAYLMSAPSSTMLGLYYLPLPTICHEIGISKKGALEALRRLSEAGFAHYDEVSEYVWVPEMAHWQIGGPLEPKDNRVKGIEKEADLLRKAPFFNAFYQRYREEFHLPDSLKVTPQASPSEAPYKPLRSQEQEQEQEQEQKQEQEKEGSSPGNPPAEPSPVPEPLAKIMPSLKRVHLKNPGELFSSWSQAYPNVDIACEILKCEAWAISKNVTRSPKGWAGTLNTWLSKEQDKSKGNSNAHGTNRERVASHATPVPGRTRITD